MKPATLKRSVFKTFTYRVLGSFITFLTGYLSTGSFNTGVIIGATDLLVKPVVYFIHELLWERKGKN